MTTLYAHEGHQGYEEIIAALDEHQVVWLHERDDSIPRPKLIGLGGIHIGADEIIGALERSARCAESSERAELVEVAEATELDAWQMVGALYAREGSDGVMLQVTLPGGPSLDWALRQDESAVVASGRAFFLDEAMEQADEALAKLDEADGGRP